MTKTQSTEHMHVAGWGGVHGECGVECACGVTYDGFDTIAEAADLLDRHIANATRAPGRPARCWLAVRRCWAWLRQRRTRPQVGSIWQDRNGRQWIANEYRNDPTDETYIVLAPTDLMGVAPYGDEVDRVEEIEKKYGPLCRLDTTDQAKVECPYLADVLAGRAQGPHDDSACGHCANLRRVRPRRRTDSEETR